MKNYTDQKNENKPCFYMGLLLLLISWTFVSCASVDPRQVDVEIKKEAPETKVTSFTESLRKLGTMTDIYGVSKLKVQSQDIADNTGTAGATGGEIPRDITEMLKSTLNSIGGRVTFIPYNPSFMQNQMITGYSNFDDKMVPDVVITGGITEFDRGLETRGSNVDASAAVDWTGVPKWAPSTTTAIDYGAGEKSGLASITLDFNMINFRTMSGIARMQTVNSIRVQKAVSEKELGITLFGPTFGLKGSIKKVQGRHAAVRLLVQLSMIQIVGKHLMLPYWTLLPNADPDPVVMDALKKYYYELENVDQIIRTQELLFVQGYDVAISGELDQQTVASLQQINADYNPANGTIDKDTFFAVYLATPITDAALERRVALNRAYEEVAVEITPAAEPEPAAASEQAVETVPAEQEYLPETQQAAAADVPASAPPEQTRKATGSSSTAVGGRMLSDDDW